MIALIKVLWPVLFGALMNAALFAVQETSNTEKVLRRIANAVLEDASFQFIDQASGKQIASPDQAPAGAQLRPQSSYNDWRYWNGVLHIAMIRMAEILDESQGREFVHENIAFSFDSYRYFEKKHTDENKWEYPFGQLFIMEELDDCGAMGASVIEVNRHAQQDRYRAYINKAAGHILTKQDRLQDSTLVRSFPHNWTVWADDLYMGISFLARMGEWSGDRRYFDDAARQVINYHFCIDM